MIAKVFAYFIALFCENH